LGAATKHQQLTMAIFSLLAKLGLDGTAFETGLKRSQSLAKSIGRDISGTVAGVFAVDKLVAFGNQALETAGKLQDLSTQLGVSAEFLQEMKFAADMGGSSLDAVSAALEKITIARGKALGGDQGLVDAFARFKVSAAEIKSAKIEDIFLKIGRAFEGDANPQNLLTPFRELAGKSAGALIPAMASGLSDAANQAHRLGMIMSTDVIDTLDEANDRVDIMRKTMEAGTGSFMAKIIEPAFRQLEALGAGIQGFFGAMFAEGRAGFQIENFFEQFAQARRAALDEMDAEIQGKREAREKRAEVRRKIEMTPEGEKFKTVAVSAATGDQLARTGGFTAFQTNMDRYFGSVKTQAQDIRDIARNTQRTAEAVEE
jgi:hypothetical protein